MKRYRLVLGIAVFAFAAFLIGQAAPNGCITPGQIYPQGDGSGLDADMVDGMHAAEITGALQKTVFSFYVEEVAGTSNSGTLTYSILTVPPGKTAVVTDIKVSACKYCIGVPNVYLSVLQDGTTKYRSYYSTPPYDRSQEFSTGIPIQSGSELSIEVDYIGLSTPYGSFMDLFVSGYLIDAAS